MSNKESPKEKDIKGASQRRGNERKIGAVIDAVQEWRNLHNGESQNNQGYQVELEEAADLVGISRKSLDDYQNQLRIGYYYKFDFNIHKDEKIGMLREYNKNFKEIYQIIQQHQKNEIELRNILQQKYKQKWQKMIKKHKLAEDKYCCFIQYLKDIVES